MRFTHGDVREPYRFVQNRPPSFVAALNSEAAAEKSKNQPSRDFSGRSIIEFLQQYQPEAAISRRLVVHHSDFDVLIPSHSRIGKLSGGTRISMLLGISA